MLERYYRLLLASDRKIYRKLHTSITAVSARLRGSMIQRNSKPISGALSVGADMGGKAETRDASHLKAESPVHPKLLANIIVKSVADLISHLSVSVKTALHMGVSGSTAINMDKMHSIRTGGKMLCRASEKIQFMLSHRPSVLPEMRPPPSLAAEAESGVSARASGALSSGASTGAASAVPAQVTVHGVLPVSSASELGVQDAISATVYPHLICFEEPVQVGDILILSQVNSISRSGTILEVE